MRGRLYPPCETAPVMFCLAGRGSMLESLALHAKSYKNGDPKRDRRSFICGSKDSDTDLVCDAVHIAVKRLFHLERFRDWRQNEL